MEFHEHHAWRKSLEVPEVGTIYELQEDYAGVNYHNKFKKGQLLVLGGIRDAMFRYRRTPCIPAEMTAELTVISKKGKVFSRTLIINVEGIHKWILEGKLKETKLDNDE